MTLRLRSVVLSSLLVTALALSGCGSTKKKGVNGDETNVGANAVDYGSIELNADSDSGKAGSLSSIYFDYNSSTLSTAAREALSTNASLLKENSGLELQVEGHCDERGGVQYNLALGEQRARAVRRYLSTMGISERRLTTISFGKGRPVSFGHDESSWGQNRRANFVVTAK
ncbi:MAG: OmpA family protein [Bacteriovoracaceae bacterium]|jgi:peptidoglycan-associated lipoprotein|nr:OmpA family protein [Bacteriovoracaceae bacterium]